MWLRIEFFLRKKFRKIFAFLGGVLLLSLVGCSEPSKTVKDPEEKPRLKDPSSIKYGARMPNLNLSDWEIKLLIEYIYSL